MDITLESNVVSGKHAELRLEADNLVVLDLGSTNGTFVNDGPVSGPTAVREGDIVRFGDIELQVQGMAQASGPSPPSQPGLSTAAARRKPAQQTRRLFISYSNDDLHLAKTLAGHLERAGWLVWMSDRSIAAGSAWSHEVLDGLRNAEAVVVLITYNSIQSPWVEREVEAAASQRIPILPVAMGGVEPSDGLRLYVNTVQRCDLQALDSGSLVMVEDALQQILRRSGPRRPAVWQHRIGQLLAGFGLLGIVAAFGIFFYFAYEAISADPFSNTDFESSVREDNQRFLRIAVAFPVFFVSMLIMGAGESLRRAAIRKRI